MVRPRLIPLSMPRTDRSMASGALRRFSTSTNECGDSHHHVVELVRHRGGNAAEGGDAARFFKLSRHLESIPLGILRVGDVAHAAVDSQWAAVFVSDHFRRCAQRSHFALAASNAVLHAQRCARSDCFIKRGGEARAIFLDDALAKFVDCRRSRGRRKSKDAKDFFRPAAVVFDEIAVEGADVIDFVDRRQRFVAPQIAHGDQRRPLIERVDRHLGEE